MGGPVLEGGIMGGLGMRPKKWCTKNGPKKFIPSENPIFSPLKKILGGEGDPGGGGGMPEKYSNSGLGMVACTNFFGLVSKLLLFCQRHIIFGGR